MPAEASGQEIADEDYNSASDEDFDPNAPTAVDRDAASSSSDDEDEAKTWSGRKRKAAAEDLDFDNSGDEATISKAKRKKKKQGKTSGDALSDDEAGEGGLVKTRAQRKAEVLEKRPTIQAGKASIDVNALWAQMSKPKEAENDPPEASEASSTAKKTGSTEANSYGREEREQSSSAKETQNQMSSANGESTVTIRRTYDFAGQTMTEEKTVPASSAEAKLYLEEQARKSGQLSSLTNGKPPLRRPKKRTSMLDDPSIMAAAAKGPKLNTLQKSKLDWAAHVDQEGISEELDEHSRAKEGYLSRMDFLNRMKSKREDDFQSIRPK